MVIHLLACSKLTHKRVWRRKKLKVKHLIWLTFLMHASDNIDGFNVIVTNRATMSHFKSVIKVNQ